MRRLVRFSPLWLRRTVTTESDLEDLAELLGQSKVRGWDCAECGNGNYALAHICAECLAPKKSLSSAPEEDASNINWLDIQPKPTAKESYELDDSLLPKRSSGRDSDASSPAKKQDAEPPALVAPWKCFSCFKYTATHPTICQNCGRRKTHKTRNERSEWTCVICGGRNADVVTRCRICDTPQSPHKVNKSSTTELLSTKQVQKAPQHKPPPPSMYLEPHDKEKFAALNVAVDRWMCFNAACRHINDRGGKIQCERCATPFPGYAPYRCQKCLFFNNRNAISCSSCGTPRPVMVICSRCKESTSPFLAACQVCKRFLHTKESIDSLAPKNSVRLLSFTCGQCNAFHRVKLPLAIGRTGRPFYTSCENCHATVLFYGKGRVVTANSTERETELDVTQAMYRKGIDDPVSEEEMTSLAAEKTWICPACDTPVAELLKTCHLCSEPKPDSSTATKPLKEDVSPATSETPIADVGVEDTWKCLRCGRSSSLRSPRCQHCPTGIRPHHVTKFIDQARRAKRRDDGGKITF